jgi:kumamolisin
MDFQPTNLVPAETIIPLEGADPAALGSYVHSYLTPPTIATAYNIPPATGLGVKIGIFSFGGGFKQSDLNSSWADLQAAGLISSKYSVPTVRQVLLDGKTGSYTENTNYSAENTLDIYCTATAAPQASITLYIGAGYDTMMAQAILDGIDIVTISWCSNEYNAESVWQSAADNKITVIAASGDWGSTLGVSGSTIQAIYPSSSPNVISAGGTKLTLTFSYARSTETDDNRDANFNSGLWGGGGGISVLFSIPSWQAGLTYTPIVNGVTGSPTALTTRGFPDFSAPMNVYILYVNGAINGYGGTSAASPCLAGFLARFQQLTGVKRSSVDWNTIAYANPSAFYDITVGTNNSVITSGYAGTAAWDPVTGLGPPIGTSLYPKLRPSSTFPKRNYGFRTTGATYPRPNSGVR